MIAVEIDGCECNRILTFMAYEIEPYELNIKSDNQHQHEEIKNDDNVAYLKRTRQHTIWVECMRLFCT